MKERPIIFSAPMVKAILSGAKSQTRRLVTTRHVAFIGGRYDNRDDPALWGFGDEDGCWHVLDQAARPWAGSGVPHESYAITCPYGVPGDRLWVRETWSHDAISLEQLRTELDDAYGSSHGPYYRADSVHENSGLTWRPSIYMPRWASRITLEVTEVRVQRLQEISEEDAKAEGVDGTGPVGNLRVWSEMGRHRYQFAGLWDRINGERAPWATNPFVWCVSFRRLAP